LEILLKADFQPCILTRSTLVLRDIDLFLKFNHIAIGFSIPTDMEKYRQIFEPGASPIKDRIEALKKFHDLGITTYAIIQPILPMNPDHLVDILSPHIDFVRIDRMYFYEFSYHIYKTNNIEFAMTPEFTNNLIDKLIRGFEKRKIILDELDNMTGLLSYKKNNRVPHK
jgi:DNA repair photolyase